MAELWANYFGADTFLITEPTGRPITVPSAWDLTVHSVDVPLTAPCTLQQCEDIWLGTHRLNRRAPPFHECGYEVLIDTRAGVGGCTDPPITGVGYQNQFTTIQIDLDDCRIELFFLVNTAQASDSMHIRYAYLDGSDKCFVGQTDWTQVINTPTTP